MKHKSGGLATEQRSVDQALEELESQKRWAEAVFARVNRITTLPPGSSVLDVGAAAGGFLIASGQLGYHCVGVEPWQEARVNAAEVSQQVGIPVNMVDGTAEAIPFYANTFDFVHASSVMEHVSDIDKAFEEIYRVLKPGGVFWFSSASAMCPVQGEIRGFRLFGWYPDRMKRRIMDWAKEARPHLVGYTQTPAINWFTPWKARATLHRHGFRQVYDRWDLRGEDEGGKAYRLALKAIRLTGASKAVADVFVPDCSYAAIK